jgi:hypothetical protein
MATMEVFQIEVKLKALRTMVGNEIRDRRSRYLDPAKVTDLFARYEPLRDEIRERFPEMFGDLPVRPRPEPRDTSDHDGRGYIARKYKVYESGASRYSASTSSGLYKAR